MKEKKNTGLIITITILGVLLLSLGTYIICDKVLAPSNENPTNDKETIKEESNKEENTTNNNSQTEENNSSNTENSSNGTTETISLDIFKKVQEETGIYKYQILDENYHTIAGVLYDVTEEERITNFKNITKENYGHQVTYNCVTYETKSCKEIEVRINNQKSFNVIPSENSKELYASNKHYIFISWDIEKVTGNYETIIYDKETGKEIIKLPRLIGEFQNEEYPEGIFCHLLLLNNALYFIYAPNFDESSYNGDNYLDLSFAKIDLSKEVLSIENIETFKGYVPQI